MSGAGSHSRAEGSPRFLPRSGDEDRSRPPLLHHARHALKRLGQVLAAIATELPPDVVVVDYGCGAEPYRRFFEAAGRRYLGADLPGNGAAQLTLDAGGRIPLPDGSASVVLSTQVLEHVGDPAAYLTECRRVLGPAGKLVLSTHGIWQYHPDPGDYWRWTSAGLRKLVEAQGFRVRRFVGVQGAASAGAQLAQDGLLSHLPPVLHAPVVLLGQLVVGLLDRVGADDRARDAATYVLVAERRG